MMKFVGTLCASLFLLGTLHAQVSNERLLKADSEPQNWLMYSGNYKGWHYSALDQITRDNARNLKLQWVKQMPTTHRIETTPLVVDGIMYLTGPPSDVYALDAATGRTYWHYHRNLPGGIVACCDQVNRGVAILGTRLFLGTIDAHLVALDAKTGVVLWDVPVADHNAGFSITGAPLVVKDMVITGVAGGEYGARCFLDAYDVNSGKRRWRFYTIPGPGEKWHETWGDGDAWQRGGSPTWLTGSYDPELNLVMWGVGNPGPDWNGDLRPGDNLYSDSAIALDADTGTLKWHFQFIPHDESDWDACEIPVLVDANWKGKPRKLVYWAHRAGFFYVLDRETGEFLLGQPFSNQTWASGLDEKGRPNRLPNSRPTPEGTWVSPEVLGATSWYSPSYSPLTGDFYLSVWESKDLYVKGDPQYIPGTGYYGSAPGNDPLADQGYGAIRALDPKTGTRIWEYKTHSKPHSGVLTTAGGVLFGASGGALSRNADDDEAYFFALGADDGKELWRINLGGTMSSNPMTYLSNGKQFVTVSAGGAVFTFSLQQ